MIGEFVFWAFAVCGTPLALAMTRLASERLHDLIPKREGLRKAMVGRRG
jgi:hypothetical protein